jgi:hypothetical protein
VSASPKYESPEAFRASVLDERGAQARFSATGFCTLPYAGQECVEWHALKSTMTTASSAKRLIGFFMVGPFGFAEVLTIETWCSDKSNGWYGASEQNVSTIRSSIFNACTDA